MCAVDGMSPRGRDHCRGGKSSLLFENFGTGNQAIKPKLASFRKQCNQPVRAASDWLRFVKKVISQSGLFPDWLRFATRCLTVTQPNWLRFVKHDQPVRALPGSASFRDVVPDHHSARLASFRKNNGRSTEVCVTDMHAVRRSASDCGLTGRHLPRQRQLEASNANSLLAPDSWTERLRTLC